MQFNHSGQELDAPAPSPRINVVDARAAFDQVLAKAGCWPRDQITRRTISEVQTRTGDWGRDASAAPSDRFFLQGLEVTASPADSDDDGIPNRWEVTHRLNPNDPQDASRLVQQGESENDRHLGYSYLEYYLNDTADRLIR
ncbi:MAG: hypothetical protein AAFX06_10760 [Planctomycetota bacterium]